MTTETMRYVPLEEVEGKHVLDVSEIQSDPGTGPYTYECSVCRQTVLANRPVQLVNVVLKCPHCGAYNETLQNPGAPT